MGGDRKPVRVPPREAAGGSSDRVEISESARHLESLRRLPDVRDPERIDALRRQIREGRYLDPAKVDQALDRMFKEEAGF